MRSPIQFVTPANLLIDVCVVPPHPFLIQNQQQLLPNWQTSVTNLILVLQQSSLSLRESTPQVAIEKKLRRAIFIRFACTLIFALQDNGYVSDLFDPRTGYPLFADPEMTFDDNAAVNALLGYPLINYAQCSLMAHPTWQHHVYPSTIVTVANRQQITTSLQQIAARQNWRLKD